MPHEQKTIGLYIHVPFCEAICHYCDFAKTARFSEEQTKAYFDSIVDLGERLIPEYLESSNSRLYSVYFGGGTPSLFTKEIDQVLSRFSKFIDPKSLSAGDRKAVNYNLDLSYRRAKSIFSYIFDTDKMQYKYQKSLKEFILKALLFLWYFSETVIFLQVRLP